MRALVAAVVAWTAIAFLILLFDPGANACGGSSRPDGRRVIIIA